MHGTYGDAERRMNKMLRLSAILALALTGLLGLGATPASAQAVAPNCPPGQPTGRPPGRPPTNPPTDARPQYPPGRCQLGLSQSSGARGDTFQASGSGFVPGENVTITMAGQRAATATAGPDGVINATVAVPNTAPTGQVEVLATGQTQSLSASFDVLAPKATAAPAARTGGTSLPRTGVEIAGITALGFVLVAIGALAVTGARRNRTASA